MTDRWRATFREELLVRLRRDVLGRLPIADLDAQQLLDQIDVVHANRVVVGEQRAYLDADVAADAFLKTILYGLHAAARHAARREVFDALHRAELGTLAAREAQVDVHERHLARALPLLAGLVGDIGNPLFLEAPLDDVDRRHVGTLACALAGANPPVPAWEFRRTLGMDASESAATLPGGGTTHAHTHIARHRALPGDQYVPGPRHQRSQTTEEAGAPHRAGHQARQDHPEGGAAPARSAGHDLGGAATGQEGRQDHGSRARPGAARPERAQQGHPPQEVQQAARVSVGAPSRGARAPRS